MTNLDLGDTRLIITECEAQGMTRAETAYLLATAFWETNRTMKPVVEAYWLSEDWRRKNLRYYPWHGRGYVQLTWKHNYVRAGTLLGEDLIGDPDKALRPDLAAKILVTGCSHGWFTGKILGDYITSRGNDFVGARRVVNGNDKAHEIAKIAREYLDALEAMPPKYSPEAISPWVAFWNALFGGWKK